MNSLDSPLEALAFNYLSYGVLTAVNNIWTVVALLTAAVSFWRIRSSVSPKSHVLRGIDDSSCAKDSLAQAEPLTDSTVTSSCFAVESTDCKRRGKFTVYYNEDNNVVGSEDSDGVYIDGDSDGCCYGGERWMESVLRVRLSGDVGWYRNQDLTVLDGNVVKFWESCRRGNGI